MFSVLRKSSCLALIAAGGLAAGAQTVGAADLYNERYGSVGSPYEDERYADIYGRPRHNFVAGKHERGYEEGYETYEKSGKDYGYKDYRGYKDYGYKDYQGYKDYGYKDTRGHKDYGYTDHRRPKDYGYKDDRGYKDYGYKDYGYKHHRGYKDYGYKDHGYEKHAACLPRHIIRDRLHSAGWSEFEDVDFQDHNVEFVATDRDGYRFRVFIDRCTGEIVDQIRIESKHTGRYASGGRSRGHHFDNRY